MADSEQSEYSPDAISATTAPVSMLRQHVVRVVLSRAEEQVIWPYTRADVAVMADEQARRHGPIVEYPRQPMRRRLLAFRDREATVAVVHDASLPQPAASLDIAQHAGPKAFKQRTASLDLSATRSTAEMSAPAKPTSHPDAERRAASWALAVQPRRGVVLQVARASAENPARIWYRSPANQASARSIELHRSSPFGAVPPVVSSGAGAFGCLDCTSA